MQNEKSVEQIIGKRIQKIRQAKGYTQQQFAEVIGLSTNYLSDIERGKSSARLDKLVAIINALECSADDVFSDVIDFGYKAPSWERAGSARSAPPAADCSSPAVSWSSVSAVPSAHAKA